MQLYCTTPRLYPPVDVTCDLLLLALSTVSRWCGEGGDGGAKCRCLHAKMTRDINMMGWHRARSEALRLDAQRAARRALPGLQSLLWDGKLSSAYIEIPYLLATDINKQNGLMKMQRRVQSTPQKYTAQVCMIKMTDLFGLEQHDRTLAGSRIST